MSKASDEKYNESAPDELVPEKIDLMKSLEAVAGGKLDETNTAKLLNKLFQKLFREKVFNKLLPAYTEHLKDPTYVRVERYWKMARLLEVMTVPSIRKGKIKLEEGVVYIYHGFRGRWHDAHKALCEVDPTVACFPLHDSDALGYFTITKENFINYLLPRIEEPPQPNLQNASAASAAAPAAGQVHKN